MAAFLLGGSRFLDPSKICLVQPPHLHSSLLHARKGDPEDLQGVYLWHPLQQLLVLICAWHPHQLLRLFLDKWQLPGWPTCQYESGRGLWLGWKYGEHHSCAKYTRSTEPLEAEGKPQHPGLVQPREVADQEPLQ